MVPAVQDSWAKRQQLGGNGRPLVSPQQLKQQLASIRETQSLVVLLVDLLDPSGSFLSRIRDVIGKNPTVVIGTKVTRNTFCGKALIFSSRSSHQI